MKDMKEKILGSTKSSCLIIFAVLIAVHAFEAIVLRMDETFFSENFINKLFGIAVMVIVMKILGWKGGDIGFKKESFLKNIGRGFLLAGISFLVSFAAELMILGGQGKHPSFGFFISGFSLAGTPTVNTGAGFILMCVFFNIVNVVMEEGTFRGLFYGVVKTDSPERSAALFQAVLFGVWHIVTPLHNLIDGDINTASFIGLSAGYIVLAGMMGIKWSMMHRLTGSLYAGMADHFFNNCLATNLLHLTTETGTDELLIVRVLIAQVISFLIVLALAKKERGKNGADAVGEAVG